MRPRDGAQGTPGPSSDLSPVASPSDVSPGGPWGRVLVGLVGQARQGIGPGAAVIGSTLLCSACRGWGGISPSVSRSSCGLRAGRERMR